MELINSILDSWQDDSKRHAMIVHLPIVLSLLGVPLAFVAVFRPKSHVLRWCVVGLFGAVLVSGYVAAESGQDAEAGIGPDITSEGNLVLHDHEDMGTRVWQLSCLPVLALALTAIPKKVVRNSASVVGCAGALLVAGWVGVTAHYGGTMVYDHGIGTGPTTPKPATPIEDGGQTPAPPADPRVVFFNESVYPILYDNCWSCHNPTRAGEHGELDLTTMRGILDGGEDYDAALKAGDVAGSQILIAVRYEDPFNEMPPDNKRLTSEQVTALEQWVRDGAVWPIEVIDGEWPDEDSAQTDQGVDSGGDGGHG